MRKQSKINVRASRLALRACFKKGFIRKKGVLYNFSGYEEKSKINVRASRALVLKKDL
jgi:hypothetical protein